MMDLGCCSCGNKQCRYCSPTTWNTEVGLQMPKIVVNKKTYYELVRDAVANAGRLSNAEKPRWSHVVDTFAIGSTSAKELCKEFGYDPETKM